MRLTYWAANDGKPMEQCRTDGSLGNFNQLLVP